MSTECTRCKGHPGIFQGVNGGYEYCGVCKYKEYNDQKVKLAYKKWFGWNPANGPMPDYCPGYVASTIIPTPTPAVPPVPEIAKIGYKFVNSDLTSKSGNTKPWRLFKKVYLDNKKPLKLCEYGFHSSDTPYDAYTYVASDIILRVERLGEILEDKDTNQKTVSRGLRPIAMVWVGDIVSIYIDCMITQAQFNQFIINRLDKYSYHKGNGFLDLKNYAFILNRKSSSHSNLVKELDRFTKVKRA